MLKPADTLADIVATLLYPVTDWPYRELYETGVVPGAPARRNEVIDVALQSRTRRDELLRNFRGAPYVFDIVMDIGAYRDLAPASALPAVPANLLGAAWVLKRRRRFEDAGLVESYEALYHMRSNVAASSAPARARNILLPFATRSRFLFKMDFAEAEYIARLRSGVKGHFSYRKIAWEMKQKMSALEPELGRLMEATPPWVEDPLQR